MKEALLKLLPDIIDIAKNAGVIIHAHFRRQDLSISKKSDNTFLTNADLLANNCIVEALKAISHYPILSEEGREFPWEERQTWPSYWLVDPLDGTRGFIDQSPEFTVNIAFIHEHQPILGVVHAPEKNVTYFAVKNAVVCKQIGNEDPLPIKTKKMSEKVHIIVGQHYNVRRMERVSEYFSEMKIARVNSSLKFGLLAEGLYDFYPRFGPICEWDTGAGHCILEEAGGVVIDFEKQALQYNLRESLNCPPFVAAGDKNSVAKIVEIYNKVRSPQ